jgi:16S rRNA processing protein RimM
VAKTQGRHGEVAVEVHSDVPGRLHAGLRVFALAAASAAAGSAKEAARRELKIEDAWPHKSYVVLKFAGVDSISEAELLLGSELQVPLAERAELESGAAYVSDLVGCAVFDQGREVGAVKDVRFGAGEAPLLVVGAGNAEFEIPFAQAFLLSVDLQGKRIEMNLPEGLLDVNAPLSAEEKEQQKQGQEHPRRKEAKS